jgi:DNA-binding NtrC family response regulator
MDQINILLVDDEEELVAAWVERFEMRGMNADGVTNGNDAIKLIKEKEYSAVVLDIKMPGMDGLEIMKQMKIEKPDLPVILITGHKCPDEEDKRMLANAQDCLVKPVSIDVLIEKIMQVIKS